MPSIVRAVLVHLVRRLPCHAQRRRSADDVALDEVGSVGVDERCPRHLGVYIVVFYIKVMITSNINVIN